MANELSLDVYFVLSIWVMVLTSGLAENEYFPQTTKATWDAARSHCQVCYKELVTLTPDNIQVIVQNLASDYWVGLRKRPVNASDNSTLFSFNDTSSFWARWANGDPLTFQNWYPGYPLIKSPHPKPDCCSCSCTCPAQPTPHPMTTTTQSVTVKNITVYDKSVLYHTTYNTSKWINDSAQSNSTPFTSVGSNYSVPNTSTPFTSVGSNDTVPNTSTPFTSVGSNDTVPNTSTPFTSVGSNYSVPNTSTPFTSVGSNDSVQSTSTPFTSVGSNDSVQSTSTPFTSIGSNDSVQHTTFKTTERVNFSVQNVTTRSTSVGPSFTTAAPATYAPLESECVKSPMLFQDAPDLDENYIEDSCVAMLSFGAWVEKDCSEPLLYICYEERFYGQVNVTKITSSSAQLTWAKAPGDIEHYRVEVNGSESVESLQNLTTSVNNLTAGTFYSAKVFPVKCERDLNPQIGNFYTVPNSVSDLQVVNVTEDCVSLNWKEPMGSVDMYLISTGVRQIVTTDRERTVCNLESGSLHTFSVQSGVSDRSEWSVNCNISAYTKPLAVSKLQTVNNTDTSLCLEWNEPKGKATSYSVDWYFHNGTHDVSLNKIVTEKTLLISDLPSGTRITLSVTAMVNDSLKGKNQTVVTFTLPKAITNLTLSSSDKTINATWSYAKGSPNFTIVLSLNNEKRDTVNTTDTNCTFGNLNGAAEYRVEVFSISGENSSIGVSESIFTLPVSPVNASLSGHNKTHLTFTWKPPNGTETVKYLVILNSTFWGIEINNTLDNITKYTFGNLKSGSKYTFRVHTKTNRNISEPSTCLSYTDSVKKEITLSMVCSSAEPLLCDTQGTRERALQKLNTELNKLLGDDVAWSLNKTKGANTGV